MIAVLTTLVGLAFWSAVAWLAMPRIHGQPWQGYALGLAFVMIVGNIRAALQARRIPTFNKA